MSFCLIEHCLPQIQYFKLLFGLVAYFPDCLAKPTLHPGLLTEPMLAELCEFTIIAHDTVWSLSYALTPAAATRRPFSSSQQR